MFTQDQLRTVVGSTAYDRSGDKIGKIGAVYFDDQTDQPKWVTVSTGLFGTNESFVPVQGADLSGDRVTLGYEKAQIKDAPNIAEDGHLTPQEEEQLYRYYNVDYSGGGYDRDYDSTRTEGVAGGVATGRSDYREGDVTTGRRETGLTGDRDHDGIPNAVDPRDSRRGVDRDRDNDGVYDDAERRGVVGHDTSGPTTDSAMTRSEEQLRVGTETAEVGRARLRKYVVTEQETVSVPVSREEVRLEREPITDANRGDAYDGPAISEEEHEVVLHAERPVVDTEAVAVERVRLNKETVTDTERVTGQVRKEQIEMDGVDDGVTGRRGTRDRDGDGIPDAVDPNDNTGRRRTGLTGDRDGDGVPNALDPNDRSGRTGVVGDKDRDGVPDSADTHDDRSVGQKVKDAVTPDRNERR